MLWYRKKLNFKPSLNSNCAFLIKWLKEKFSGWNYCQVKVRLYSGLSASDREPRLFLGVRLRRTVFRNILTEIWFRFLDKNKDYVWSRTFFWFSHENFSFYFDFDRIFLVPCASLCLSICLCVPNAFIKFINLSKHWAF